MNLSTSPTSKWKVDASIERANLAHQRTTQLDDAIMLMQQQLTMMMKWQLDDTSTCTSQIHPHYAENFDHQSFTWNP